MERKEYIRDIYSRYWVTARKTKYGFGKYDHALCDLIMEKVPEKGRLLEVAVGTGEPIADFLQRNGYEVYGIDIAPNLIEECKRTNPAIHASVGDAENISFPDDSFDATYCFHATCHFPSLTKVLEEMLRVTKPGGVVFFDIQNKKNPVIAETYQRRIELTQFPARALRFLKNCLRPFLGKKIVPEWNFMIYETPTDPEEIQAFFQGKMLTGFSVMAPDAKAELVTLSAESSFSEFPGLVFICDKT